jgi:hypothetical protein
VLDGVYNNGGSIQLTNAWEVDAWYEHYWSPLWRTSLFGAYSKIMYGGTGSALLYGGLSNPAQNALGVLTATPGTAPNMDFAIAQIGTKTSWMPVKDLTFSAEVIYSRLMPSYSGTFTNGATQGVSGAAPGAIYTVGSQNIFNGAVQVIRSF